MRSESEVRQELTDAFEALERCKNVPKDVTGNAMAAFCWSQAQLEAKATIRVLKWVLSQTEEYLCFILTEKFAPGP